MATEKVFYWIALQTPNGAIDVRGPYNTMQGRDKEYVENSDFWASADVPAVRFETIGRKKAEAYSYAAQVLEQSAAPQGNEPSATTTQQIPEIVTKTPSPRPQPVETFEPSISTEGSVRQEMGANEAIEKSMETPKEESLEDVASMFRGENVGADVGPEELEFGGNSSEGLFDGDMDSAIQAEVGQADEYERNVFAGF